MTQRSQESHLSAFVGFVFESSLGCFGYGNLFNCHVLEILVPAVPAATCFETSLDRGAIIDDAFGSCGRAPGAATDEK